MGQIDITGNLPLQSILQHALPSVQHESEEPQMRTRGPQREISMYQLAIEIQSAKDDQVARKLAGQTKEIETINTRAIFIADLIQKLLIERNKDEEFADLSDLEELINEYREIHHPNTGYIDPFYGMDTRRVKSNELDRCLANLQEVMRRDTLELGRIGRENEFLIHLYTTVTEMMTRQKPDEMKTIIRHMGEGR